MAGLQSSYIGPEPHDALSKGILAEQIVAQELLSVTCKEAESPSFWVREESQSNAEVDFFMQRRGVLVPVEVKSGKTGTLRSLHSWIDRAALVVESHTSTTVILASRLYSGSFSIEHARTPQGTHYTLINLLLFLTSRTGANIDKFLGG